MANPVSISAFHRDTGGYAQISGTVSASYVRSGSKVTITITVTLGSDPYPLHAYRYGVDIGGVTFISQDNSLTTATKTYTYDDASAKTYSYSVSTYLQTARSYSGYTDTYSSLTIAVPAAGAEAYIKVNGTWKKASAVYVKVNGAWKECIVKFKTGGVWK